MNPTGLATGMEAQKVYRVVRDEVRVLVGGKEGDGRLELFEVSGPRESGPPPHTHAWNEAYYILDGEIEIRTGDSAETICAGRFVRIPARTIHSYRILSETARFLVLTDPAGASRFFADMDGLVELEEMLPVVARHDLTVHLPA